MSKSFSLVLRMEESDSLTPKSRTNFTQILLESVNESISVALGRPITPELNHHLQAYIGLSVDEMQDNVDLLFSSLRDSFGIHGDDIRKMVVRRMYQKAGIPFYEVAGTHMIQYVHELKRKLTMIEYSIKP
ncbi:MAG: hypothetical protein ABSD49_07735 [Candidatus Bathyarchaeia archaeon]